MNWDAARVLAEERQARLRADYAAGRRTAVGLRAAVRPAAAVVLRLRRDLGWALVDAGIRLAAAPPRPPRSRLASGER